MTGKPIDPALAALLPPVGRQSINLAEWAIRTAAIITEVAEGHRYEQQIEAILLDAVKELAPVGQPASLHIELLDLSVCLMRFDELNAGQTVRVIGVPGVVELIEAVRTLVARHEAEAPVGQPEEEEKK